MDYPSQLREMKFSIILQPHFFLSFIVFSINRPTVGQDNEKVGIYRSQNTIHRQEAAKSIWEKSLVVPWSILMNENTISKNKYKIIQFVQKSKEKLANTSGHAQDKTPNVLLRNVLPFFSEGSCQSSKWYGTALSHSSSQFIPQALKGIEVSTWWPIDPSDARNSRMVRQRWGVALLSWRYQVNCRGLTLDDQKGSVRSPLHSGFLEALPRVIFYCNRWLPWLLLSRLRRQSWSANEILTKDSFQFTDPNDSSQLHDIVLVLSYLWTPVRHEASLTNERQA